MYFGCISYIGEPLVCRLDVSGNRFNTHHAIAKLGEPTDSHGSRFHQPTTMTRMNRVEMRLYARSY